MDILTVTHRSAVGQIADSIYAFEKGRVVECGAEERDGKLPPPDRPRGTRLGCKNTGPCVGLAQVAQLLS
jgi:hypothetical protein